MYLAAIISLGIFIFIAYMVVTFILLKNQLSIGPWVLFGISGFLFSLSVVAEEVGGNLYLKKLLFLVAMLLLFFASFFKLFDILGLYEDKKP